MKFNWNNEIFKRYGKLTVIGITKRSETCFIVRCDCGREKIVRAHDVRKGDTTSCGCLTHYAIENLSQTRIYNIYTAMKQRCYNKKSTNYRFYGARGITICKEWFDNFMKFYEWSMSHGYKDDLTIDRIDNYKGYSPDNCRWVDRLTQNNNLRTNRLITFNGETKTLAQWGRLCKVDPTTIAHRLKRGLSVKEALKELSELPM